MPTAPDPDTLPYATPPRQGPAPPNRRAFVAGASCLLVFFLRFLPPNFPINPVYAAFFFLAVAFVFSIGALVHAIRYRALGCAAVVALLSLLFSLLGSLLLWAMLDFPAQS